MTEDEGMSEERGRVTEGEGMRVRREKVSEKISGWSITQAGPF